MASKIAPWNRPYHADSPGDALLFYVVFGDITQTEPVSPQKYRCESIPEGFDFVTFDKAQHADYLASFCAGHAWATFETDNPAWAERVRESPSCTVVRGTRRNPETLNYLRDTVGLVTYFLDCGASVIYDPQILRWWTADAWRQHIFAPAAPVPQQHAILLVSEDKENAPLAWFHTRGMRKFGRPDISIKSVAERHQEAVIDLCQRFIEYQALGAVIPEGEPIRMKSLPPGGVARHGGDLDDPDFNNVHVEIVWPKPGLT